MVCYNLKFSLSHFVFARSLRIAYSFDFFEAAQAKESWGGGEEEPDFLLSKNVALCLFISKAMAVLRWSSSPREQAHYRECDKV